MLLSRLRRTLNHSLLLITALMALVAADRAHAADETVRFERARQPQLAAGADEQVHLTFVRADAIWAATSTDGGRTFSDSVRVAAPRGLMAGMRRGPRLAVAGDAIVITAIAENPQSGEEGALLAWRSEDSGRTWAGSPQLITSVEGAAREGLHDTAGHPSGKVAAVWLDLRNVTNGGGTEVWLSTSDDGGDTWGKERLLYRNERGTVCECCHPSVAFDADGNPVVMFRNALAGNRDMYLTGEDGRAEKLGRGTWPLEACPMDGGDLARGNDGWWTAWRRAGTVYLAQPGEGEAAVGEGEQPVVAHTAQGPHVFWTDGDRLHHRNPPGEVATLADDAAWPAVASLADAVLVAYESGNAAAVRRVAVNPEQTNHGERP